MMNCRLSLLLCALVHSLTFYSASAFVTPTKCPGAQFSSLSPIEKNGHQHKSVQQQRHSVGNIQVQGLFGLGAPEIAVILAVGAFIVGPEKLGSFAGELKESLNEVPDELKKIPEEFQKGVEEGEINARSRNAKTMKKAPALKKGEE
ncbi:unnamed protein product [Cylindrotheca closterium]|uniref:Uncharacterized protein n=1 Tax=Cylindrotheca closterium TaxID=2856 RepID=A0AAD2FRD1_9STRA|nr:unnamed protein product [Cylindrotheca closterium]